MQPSTLSQPTSEQRDVANLLHPFTNARKHQEAGPHVLASGKGVWVYDEAGKAYLEGMAGLWCTALGYGEERLVEAAARQMRQLPYAHLFTSKTTRQLSSPNG
jgi:4-aminobutyrate--pyruvate transaminase